MKYELSVGERLSLLNILPPKGDITTLRIVADLQHDLGLSEEEIKTIGLRQEKGSVQWDATAEKNKKIEIGDKGKEIIVSALRKLDESKDLTIQLLGLWNTFVEE